MIRQILDLVFFGSLFLLLAFAVSSLPLDVPGLAPAALERIPESGVDNPVTAVLLNFRSYDTLLEIAVLLLALLGTWSVSPARQALVPADSPSLESLIRLLVPAMTIGAGYILWIGSYAPGGAFQAGAILAAALVLIHLAGLTHSQALGEKRGLLAIGLLVFMGAALLPLLTGESLLQYPEGADKPFILAIEGAATISIALTLSALFTGRRLTQSVSP